MKFSVGDYVTRISYNNDTLFKIINISDEIYYLKGVEVSIEEGGDIAGLDEHQNVWLKIEMDPSYSEEEVELF